MSEYEFYTVTRQGPMGVVHLNRPEQHNAMTPPAWAEAIDIFDALDADADIRVVILAGNGPSFCSGIDLAEMMAAIPELSDPRLLGGAKWRLVRRIGELQETMNAIERCRKPVIAAVHGFCIGAGLNLAAACDIRFCSKNARFSLKEAAVGIVADVGVLQRLPRIIGEGFTRELAYTAKTVKAERAREMGLVNAVYADHDALMAGVEATADAIAANSPLAVQAAKDVLNFSSGKPVAEGLRYVAGISANLLPSGDLAEAMAAFAEKRKPDFKGE